MADERDLESLRAEEADLSGCDFSGADLSHRSLQSRDFTRANFAHSVIIHTDFSESNFKHSLFNDTTAKGAVFDQCNMAASILKSDFRGASFKDASFVGSSIRTTNFDLADLQGTSFFNCHIQEGCSFNGAITDERTNFEGAQVSRRLSGEEVFNRYAYVSGRLRLRDEFPPNEATSTTKQIAEDASGAVSARVIRHIAERPHDIARLANSLTILIENEIELASAEKPNDAQALRKWQEQIGFLQELSEGLRQLHIAIIQNAENSAPPAEKFAVAGRTVWKLRTNLENWISTNGSEIIDGTVRVALIGACTGFLGVVGAPVTGALAISSLLLGGPKLTRIAADLNMKTKDG